MSKSTATSEPASTAIDRPHPPPTGTWTIDPANSRVSLAWRRLRRWTVTGRLHCLGVVHLDDLPLVGVIRFEQSSGLPVLTMALELASVETGDDDLAAMLRGPAVSDALRHRWWTLRSESLEVLPTGTLRVMATLTAGGTTGLIELHFEIDPGGSRPDWLVLRGRGVLDRRAFGMSKRTLIFDPKIQLDLTLHARRAGTHTSTESQDGDGHTNHHAGLSPVLAASPAQSWAAAASGCWPGGRRLGGIELTDRHAEVAPQVPMHIVATLTDPHPSEAGRLSPPTPPIGRYRRVPVQIHQADPAAPEVARRLIALIATRWPATPAEHVGSSAVPGLAGKNTIDLLLAADPAHIPAITQALLGLGFQPQVPAAFPATRPMLWGAFRHGLTDYRVHVHVVPAASPEVTALRGFRDALGADPLLRRRYAALKRAIVAGGPVDPVAFTKAKHDWIVATLARLGLANDQPHHLYQDLDLDRSHRLAS